MKESESFELLGLPKTASIKEINARFREIASQIHPDKGGDNHAMSELLFARESAIRSARNRKIEPVDILKEFQRINTEVSKRADQREITRKLVRMIQSNRLGKYRRYRVGAAVMAVFFGAITVIGTGLISALSLPASFTDPSAALTITFILIYVTSSSITESLEGEWDELCDLIDHRSTYEVLVHCLDLAFIKPQPFTKNQLEDFISRWTVSNSDELERIRSLAKGVGEPYFTRLLISKGIELGVIREHKIVEGGRTHIGYSLKEVITPRGHRHAQS